MKLKIKVEKIDDIVRKVTCEVDSDSVSNELTKQYKKYAKKYRFPGFRAGKAPRPVVDAAVGKEAVYIDATQEIVDGALRQAIEDKKLALASEPRFDSKETKDLITDKEPYKFVFSFDTYPEVELSSYDPIEGYLPQSQATDEELEEQLKNYASYFAVDGVEPEIDEKFATEKMNFESLDDMKKHIKDMITSEKEAAFERLKADIVAIKLRERLSVEPTEEMVEYLNTELLGEMFKDLQRYGTTFDQYLKNRNLTAEQFYEDVKKQAADECKTRMAADIWAKHFKCECTKKDISDEFKAAGFKDVETEEKKWIDDGKLWKLREGITRKKAFDNAIENAKWTIDDEKAKHQFDYLNKSEEK